MSKLNDNTYVWSLITKFYAWYICLCLMHNICIIFITYVYIYDNHKDIYRYSYNTIKIWNNTHSVCSFTTYGRQCMCFTSESSRPSTLFVLMFNSAYTYRSIYVQCTCTRWGTGRTRFFPGRSTKFKSM